MNGTSDTSGFHVTPQPDGNSPGYYRIDFKKPFADMPTVLANVISESAAMAHNQYNVGVRPARDHVIIEIAIGNAHTPADFSFAAFGEFA